MLKESQANEPLARTSRTALPGPTGLDLWLWGLSVPRKPLETYQRLHQSFGDLAYCGWKNRETLFVFHPDAIGHVLKDNHQNYIKGRDYAEMKPLLGGGLLLSEGSLWRQQRQLMAKEFHHARVESFRPVIQEEAQKLVSAWSAASAKEAGEFDASPLFMQVTFDIACRLFFGQLLREQNAQVKESLDFETLRVSRRIRRIMNLPRKFPIKENRQGEKAIEYLNSVVDSIIATADPLANNLLSRLLNFETSEGHKLPRELVRHEVMTMMLAGHETTSNLLSWAIYLLGKNPQWQERCRQESTGPLLDWVLQETMRLYPPAPMISRLAKNDDVILGYPISAGTNVLTLQWVTHRDPKYWENQEEFNTERFSRPLKHKYYYFPISFCTRY
jgi:cytochrome P450